MSKLARLLTVRSPAELYQSLAGQWHGEKVLISEPSSTSLLTGPSRSSEFADWMMRQDVEGYLADDILVKVDRASMAVSLETRAPFLDYQLAELAAGLPLRDKIRGNQGKWALRQMLARRLPPELLARPKTGFSPPLGAWLRGPLREWAEDLLAPIPQQGILLPEPIMLRWREHQERRRDWSYPLWTVLTFQSWLQNSPLGW